MNACKIVVSGRVQGVFFRAHTEIEANKLGITGWVRNNADGTVELLACGNEKQLDQLIQWCSCGSPLARVDHVAVESIEHSDFFDSFRIRR